MSWAFGPGWVQAVSKLYVSKSVVKKVGFIALSFEVGSLQKYPFLMK